MSYTYAPHQPEVYDGKVFLVTMDEGEPPPFLVSTANGESEIPALVEHHLNPPPQAPYPPAPPPAPDANARLDAGIVAAYDVAVAVKTAMQATPNTFSNANFTVAMIQLDALTAAFVEMLKAQMPPVPPP